MTPGAATGMGTRGILAQMRRKLSLPGLYRLVLKGLMGSGVLSFLAWHFLLPWSSAGLYSPSWLAPLDPPWEELRQQDKEVCWPRNTSRGEAASAGPPFLEKNPLPHFPDVACSVKNQISAPKCLMHTVQRDRTPQPQWDVKGEHVQTPQTPPVPAVLPLEERWKRS